jgi:hypothetical protein
VNRRTLALFAFCLCVLAFPGRASADVIIDENFGANTLIYSPRASAMIRMDMMGMWMGGSTMAMGTGMWMVMSGRAMGNVKMATGMGMGMDAAWNTLVYFAAQPPGGWGGNDLTFRFGYHTEDFGAGLVAKYGVYGWMGGEVVPLGSEYPGSDGFALIEDMLTLGSEWHRVEAAYRGDLSPFSFIGATFTIGDATADEQGVALEIDDVRLEAVPEPASMSLGASLAMAAYVRRWLRRRRRATGPPG